jgi:CDP-diacylglycerol--serine O-phosphatidyltransferase
MSSVKTQIPNAITCANLFSGCLGIVFAFQHNLLFASYAIFLSALFDFFDGLAARALNSFSSIGKDLDSLADVVSFGVLPAVILYQLMLLAPQIAGVSQYLNYIVFLIPVFSALRLAKFNNDTRQKEIFIGLPTPANAILIASFPLIIRQGNAFYSEYILNPFFLGCFVLIMCSLLVAEIPLMSLKFKGKAMGENIYRYLLLGISAVMIIIFKFAAIPVVIFIYIALSIIQFRVADDKVPSRN